MSDVTLSMDTANIYTSAEFAQDATAVNGTAHFQYLSLEIIEKQDTRKQPDYSTHRIVEGCDRDQTKAPIPCPVSANWTLQ